jgi:hypothetical protein
METDERWGRLSARPGAQRPDIDYSLLMFEGQAGLVGEGFEEVVGGLAGVGGVVNEGEIELGDLHLDTFVEHGDSGGSAEFVQHGRGRPVAAGLAASGI